MPPSNPLLGTLLHTVGASSAALCYAPLRGVKRWNWQTYWLSQASICWLVLPWIFAWLTIPELGAVLHEASGRAMMNSYLLGTLYGVGGIAFGVSIRYIGYSLTYALAIGISCVFGTLLPPLLQGTLGAALGTPAGKYVVWGVVVGGVAMVVTGLAGLRREREAGTASAFNPRLGLPICLLAGVLSAVFNFSLQAGQPIADVAARHHAGNFQGNVIYLFSNSGAFTTTLVYCAWLATRRRTWSEFGGGGGRPLGTNYALAALTGLLWYLQFFFYGLAHVRMGPLKFSSWAIHMIILILLSCGFGVLIGEWKVAGTPTKAMLALAIVLLIGSVGFITFGNYHAG